MVAITQRNLTLEVLILLHCSDIIDIYSIDSRGSNVFLQIGNLTCHLKTTRTQEQTLQKSCKDNLQT